MPDRTWMGGLLLASALALLPGAARAAPGVQPAPDPYEAALAAARGEASAGRFSAAAGLLEAPVATWPQDFPLQLARAYYLLRAGRYEAAAAGYRAALALAPDSEEAHRGLDDALARRGAPSQAWLGVHGSGTGWSGQTGRTTLATGAVTLDARLADRWTVGLLYRGLVSPGTVTGGGGGRGSGRTSSVTASSVSHEGHLELGLALPRWSLTLHGAAVSGATVTSGGAAQVYGYQGLGGGVTAALRLGLDWRASVALISWEDQASGQVEATAGLPLGHHLSLQAGWRGQQLDGSTTGAALLGVAWRSAWTLSLRGEYGAQRRPWDLADRTLYGIPEELLAAARLQASVPLGGAVRGWLGADLERWRTPVAGGDPLDADAARVSAGLSFAF